MKKCLLFLLLLMFVTAPFSMAEPINKAYPFSLDYNKDRTILNVFRTPAGYERYPTKEMNIYMAWLTNMPLKPEKHPVVKWDSQIMMGPDSINGVVDLGITSMNQKDPDLAIQLVIEFLRAAKQLERFPIQFNEKDTVSYGRYLSGKYSTDARGNLIYKEGEERESNEKEYYRFLEFVMGRIDNKSILYNLTPVEDKDVAPGCLYIQFDSDGPDSVGHTAIIFDVAVSKNDKGDILLLPGWGGIPAHNLYLARPFPIVPNNIWFTLDSFKERMAEYGKGKFYRFKML
ncbi:MAG: DUF4846 domain-containing protein [Candidatus Zixiibacteriota bacterium]